MISFDFLDTIQLHFITPFHQTALLVTIDSELIIGSQLLFDRLDIFLRSSVVWVMDLEGLEFRFSYVEFFQDLSSILCLLSFFVQDHLRCDDIVR